MRHFRAHTSLSKVLILETPPKHSSLNLPAFRSPLYESLVILSTCNRERDEGLEHEGGQIMMFFICLFICLSVCSVLGLLLDVFVIQDGITNPITNHQSFQNEENHRFHRSDHWYQKENLLCSYFVSVSYEMNIYTS